MSLSGSDMGAPLAPERRGFAQALHEIRRHLSGARTVELYGAAGSLGAAIAAQLGSDGGDPLLYVVADEETAEARAHDLGFFLPHPPASDDPLVPPSVLELPAPDSSPYAEMQPDRATTLRRMAALFRLSRGFSPQVLVASAAALFRRVVPRAPFEGLCQRIADHATLDRDATLAAVYFHPVRETIATAGADPRAKVLAAADAAVYPSSKIRRLLEQIDGGETFFGIEALAPAFHAQMAPFFDYLPAGALCVVEDPEAVLGEARRQASRLREAAAARQAEHRLALPALDFVLGEDEATAALEARRRLELRPVEIARFADPAGAPPRVHIQSTPHTTLRAELQQARAETVGHGDEIDIGRPLRDRLRSWLAAGQRVRAVATSRMHADRLVGLFRALGLAAEVAPGEAAAPFDLKAADAPNSTGAPKATAGAPLAVLVL